MTRLNGHERHEWNALLDDANKLDGSTRQRGEEVIRLLNDAVQAHQPWADTLINGWVLSGAMNAATARHKRTGVRSVALKRAKRSRSMVVGTTWTDPTTGVSADTQQSMLDMSWDALTERARASKRRVRDLGFTVATDAKVMALRAKCPKSATPREACRLLGIDFDNYMAAAS